MKSQTTALPTMLEVGIGKSINRQMVCVYILLLIGIPWVASGFLVSTGTVGDTEINGYVVWILRLFLLGFWVTCLMAAKRSIDFLRHLPILFTLDNSGITDRKGVTTLWDDIDKVVYKSRGWKELRIYSNSPNKKIIVSEIEADFSALGNMIAFIRLYAPAESTKKL